ncbi:MAG: NADP-dependent malic enzyme [Oscillospiraceae bacterium]|nr:NADP-dependent malic enzyme [Oscillospiraceae bacterium]
MATDVYQESLALHAKNKGKVSVQSKVEVNSKEDLSLAYSPGVAQPCREIAKDPEEAYKYTSKGNMIAVVSDGSAVLGLGDIGGLAGLPVMEGKAILFKEFGDVDAFPICLDTEHIKAMDCDEAEKEKLIIDEIVNTVKLISPNFGGVNLEDIKAPRCFEVENRLKAEANIPIFHDDQHGTAIVVTAALINAAKVVGKQLKDLTVVINGIGSAGSATARMLLKAGVADMRLVDMNGILNKDNPKSMLNWNHEELAKLTNAEGRNGDLAEAVRGADVFVGVSAPGLLTQAMVQTMAKDSIIFAMANPTPEIFPDEAKAGGAAVVGTGRSDYPNQVNNVLVFPGIFKGVLAARADDFTDGINMAAAKALASYIPDDQLSAENIMPSALDKNVAQVIADAVMEHVRKQG